MKHWDLAFILTMWLEKPLGQSKAEVGRLKAITAHCATDCSCLQCSYFQHERSVVSSNINKFQQVMFTKFNK